MAVTSAPFSASSNAVARPIPDVPPNTTAFLPDNSIETPFILSLLIFSFPDLGKTFNIKFHIIIFISLTYR